MRVIATFLFLPAPILSVHGNSRSFLKVCGLWNLCCAHTENTFSLHMFVQKSNISSSGFPRIQHHFHWFLLYRVTCELWFDFIFICSCLHFQSSFDSGRLLSEIFSVPKNKYASKWAWRKCFYCDELSDNHAWVSIASQATPAHCTWIEFMWQHCLHQTPRIAALVCGGRCLAIAARRARCVPFALRTSSLAIYDRWRRSRTLRAPSICVLPAGRCARVRRTTLCAVRS